MEKIKINTGIVDRKVKDGEEKTPSQLKIPSYMMNFPFSLSTDNPNNIFMTRDKMPPLDKDKAFGQFMKVFNFMASQGLVYLLPTAAEFQDLPYVANIGMYLPHDDKQIFVLSNFTSEPRQGEEDIANVMFKLMRYTTIKCPFKWEGEAELKWLHDNVYIGGYGIRSQKEAYDWFEKEFNMKIIKVNVTSEEQYHLDCSIFPINSKKTFVFVDNYTKDEIKEIEKETEIISVPKDLYKGDPTNCVLFYNMLLCSNGINELKRNDKDYQLELSKIHFLETQCSLNGLELVTFNVSEFAKSGAALSCQVLNLNYESYKIPLI
jgi:N-dimethylarginine dimethylaminohydrolase